MTDIHSLYNVYTTYTNLILESNDISNFKNHPSYTYMLEHVNEGQGHEYLRLIKEKFNLPDSEIIAFAFMNDAIGNPRKYTFLNIQMSPTSLRYMFQAMLILTHFNSKCTGQPIQIVEVGGGYGGLCLAINFCLRFFPELAISSYTIIDLEAPTKLQTKYLSFHKLSYSLRTQLAETFGSDIPSGENNYLISNYCFSEIDKLLQAKYVATLFPKLVHGFIAWNNIPLYDIGKTVEYEEEYPKTGPMNLYVRF